MLERIEALRQCISTDWHDATTSEVMRAAIHAGLAEVEKAHAEELSKKRHKPA